MLLCLSPRHDGGRVHLRLPLPGGHLRHRGQGVHRVAQQQLPHREVDCPSQLWSGDMLVLLNALAEVTQPVGEVAGSQQGRL